MWLLVYSSIFSLANHCSILNTEQIIEQPDCFIFPFFGPLYYIWDNQLLAWWWLLALTTLNLKTGGCVLSSLPWLLVSLGVSLWNVFLLVKNMEFILPWALLFTKRLRWKDLAKLKSTVEGTRKISSDGSSHVEKHWPLYWEPLSNFDLCFAVTFSIFISLFDFTVHFHLEFGCSFFSCMESVLRLSVYASVFCILYKSGSLFACPCKCNLSYSWDVALCKVILLHLLCSMGTILLLGPVRGVLVSWCWFLFFIWNCVLFWGKWLAGVMNQLDARSDLMIWNREA